MKIDLKEKKSEAEWQRTVDRFALAATPKWFEWLGWVLILGALTFLEKKVDSVALHILLGISGGLFVLYFFNFFYQFEFENIPFIKSPAVARIVSIVLAGAIGTGLWFLFRAVIDVLGETGT